MQKFQLTDKCYFTSDHHFFHANIIEHCNRPFEDAEEMNEALVDNWNSKVHNAKCTVFMIGDVAAGRFEQEALRKLLNRLKGKKILIRGNHDNRLKAKALSAFHQVHSYAEGFIEKGRTPSVDGRDYERLVTMFHYPIMKWNKQRYGSWHVHGHSHTQNQPKALNNMFDVGVDNNNYTPLSLQELIEKFV